MKKFYLFAISALVMMAGCSKQSVEPVQVEDNSPVAVTFGVSAPAVQITKAAVDAWASQDLYIYGLTRKDNTLFIDNVKVAAPATGTEGEITPKHEVSAGEGAAAVEEPFYYSATNTTYDFYGYYVDDAAGTAPAPTVNAGEITLPVTITGSQDIMLAKANQIEDVKTTSVDPSRAYSAYSARKGVTPRLVFEHQLARFDFNVIAGDAAAVNNVFVKNVTLKEVYDKGTLTIAGAERGAVPTTTETKVDFKLAIDENGVAPASETEKTSLGASLMVFPGETSHTLDFDVTQTGVTSPIASDPVTLDVTSFKDAQGNAHTEFMAGYKYTVTIKVYSNQPVEIIAELDAWEDAGEYEYDPDNAWTEETVIPETGAAYVYDDLSWATIPASYRNKYPWDDATYATFPWLVAWVEASDAARALTVEVTAPAGETLDLTKGVLKTWPNVTNITANTFEVAFTGASLGVLTFTPADFGVTDFPAGEWAFTITDKASGNVLLNAGKATVK